MICFRDMTFCPFWIDCKDGKTCDRALTGKIYEAADKWWGGPEAPIMQFVEKPECFVENKSERV